MPVPTVFERFFRPGTAAIERRLHKRAVLYWQKAAAGRDLVTLSDFDPLAIEDQSSHGFILDLRQPSDPVFTYIGPVLEQEAAVELSQVRLSEVRGGSLLMRFASHFPRVLESKAPLTAEYDFTTEADYHVQCRGALLPLSSDGVAVDHVYGVISWKSEKVSP